LNVTPYLCSCHWKTESPVNPLGYENVPTVLRQVDEYKLVQDSLRGVASISIIAKELFNTDKHTIDNNSQIVEGIFLMLQHP